MAESAFGKFSRLGQTGQKQEKDESNRENFFCKNFVSPFIPPPSFISPLSCVFEEELGVVFGETARAITGQAENSRSEARWLDVMNITSSHRRSLTGTLRCWYKFPFGVGTYGEVISEGMGDGGRIKLWMRIGEGGKGWQIDAVWWSYVDGRGGSG